MLEAPSFVAELYLLQFEVVEFEGLVRTSEPALEVVADTIAVDTIAADKVRELASVAEAKLAVFGRKRCFALRLVDLQVAEQHWAAIQTADLEPFHAARTSVEPFPAERHPFAADSSILVVMASNRRAAAFLAATLRSFAPFLEVPSVPFAFAVPSAEMLPGPDSSLKYSAASYYLLKFSANSLLLEVH